MVTFNHNNLHAWYSLVGELGELALYLHVIMICYRGLLRFTCRSTNKFVMLMYANICGWACLQVFAI